MARKIELNFELWPRQLDALNSFATERLYGGAAGGGKSHLERIESIALCLEVPGLQYFLFRRNFQDLQKSYVQGPSGYNALLGELIHEGHVDSVAKEVRFPNSSRIYLCHCQHEKDVFGFNSFEFHVLNIAEIGEFTPFMIKYLRSRVRMDKGFQAKLPKRFIVPKEYWRSADQPEYSLPKATYTCNPAGPAKAYLKQQFVDGHRPGQIWRAPDEEGGMLRQFIPAKLSDNPALDPVQYAAQLKGIGSKAYVDALLDGDWSTTIGAFFPQIDKSKHLVRAFRMPEHWPKFLAMDWGACGDGDPFSLGWYAVSDGSVPVFSAYTRDPMPCPRNSLICYRRWNGAGLPKQDAVQVARGILSREHENILFRIAGGDIMERKGHGESIFTLFAKEGVHFKRADMRRLNGWGQVDYRLTGENDAPLSFWFEDCEGDLDSMGNLQHDLHNPNDTAPGDDHDADRHRYACMTRPITKDAPQAAEPDLRDKNRRWNVSDIVAHVSQAEKAPLTTRR